MKMKRVIMVILALTLIVSGLPFGANAAEGSELEALIAQLPEVSDPLGTEYYFYNQLSDIEKVFYWKMSEATWEDPTITISGVGGYTQEQLSSLAGRAWSALLADDPEYHMYWERWSLQEISFDGGRYVFSLIRPQYTSEYLVQKAKARIQQIVDTIGMEGDTYSRTRELVELMYQEMDYDPYHPFLSNQKGFYNDSAIGCLIFDRAVCAGFSDTVKILCDYLDIPCIVVGNAGHAWNYVKMDDGLWYAVDTSRDVPFDWNCNIIGSGSEQYDGNYFLSDLYLSTEGDFSFPTLNEEAYVYPGEFSESYHSVESTFVEPGPTFVYEVNDDGVSCTVVAYEGPQEGDLVIPSQIDGYSVTAIGDTAFYGCTGFTGDLVIPDTVKTVGVATFMSCTGLTGELRLSNNLETIEAYAFLGNSDMSGALDFPKSLKSIGRCAFYDCAGLSGDIVLPEGITLGDEIFFNCKSVTGTLYLPDSMVWDGNIVLGSGITKIHVNETNENFASYDGMLFSKDMKTLLACPGGKTGDLIIPEGVETIARIACYECSNLTGTLTLPGSLKTIEEFAFQGASLSGDLVIPDSVETIGANAFAGCGFQGTLTLPKNLMRIEDYAFFGCKFIGDLIIPDKVTYIGEYAFFAAEFQGKLEMSKAIEYIGSYAMGGEYSNSLELKGNEVVVEEQAFFGVWFDYFSCSCGVEYDMQPHGQEEMWYSCPRCGGSYRAVNGWAKKSGVWYYYRNGQKVTGWLKDGGYWYYLDSTGAMTTGWVKVGSNWYYMNKSGVMQTGWVKVNGYWYYMASGGAMQTGWVSVGGKWYYMASGGAMQTGWVSVGGKWYYMASGGAMQTGWITVGSSRYYLDSKGVMQTGWIQLDGTWYYLTSSGAMATGWTHDGSYWYYMDANGMMQRGWITVGGKWYYLNKSGVMQTGWLKDGNYWYYLDATGVMLTGTHVIGGKTYVFNKSGVWIG